LTVAITTNNKRSIAIAKEASTTITKKATALKNTYPLDRYHIRDSKKYPSKSKMFGKR
jgi:hypothetical protein